MIHSFYAVTATSVYFVKDRRSTTDLAPVAKKIALKGSSSIPVGGELSGGKIAIMKCLQFYMPEGVGRRIERNTQWWKGGSSDIVALFIARREALDCFSRNKLQSLDRRWLKNTREVLEKIGENHPVFYVCRSGENALIVA